MSIPNSISYRNVKPLGIPSKVRRTAFVPTNVYNGEIKPDDHVRFHIKAPAFWDPYNTYVRMKIDFSDMESGCVQQLDSSAQSFITEMVISAGSQELERIMEYDTLAAILMDMSYDNHGRLSKQHEGLSSEILPTNNFHNIVINYTTNLRLLEIPDPSVFRCVGLRDQARLLSEFFLNQNLGCRWFL